MGDRDENTKKSTAVDWVVVSASIIGIVLVGLGFVAASVSEHSTARDQQIGISDTSSF
ncbi:hypothetical protein [Jannaschia aquimarina]|uniref:Uncharacterized protein n=1 Tax=Jannaschia aquimarina TaxID=935700 RepID=A0A0D1D9G7_9RHOB|nr:hypothetical protein [Jannaschia aquimarina]KIT16538.1 hypothetical protein jaqu_17660 [Jannaschia aquimarina]SNT06204.1 hypothetical protein SAMN05421775_10579 [Jannaschia aquimarina]